MLRDIFYYNSKVVDLGGHVVVEKTNVFNGSILVACMLTSVRER